MQDGLPLKEEKSSSTTSNRESTSKQSTSQVGDQPLIRINFPESESTLLPAFEDIQNDPQKQNIELFASIGLLQGDGQGKFHPTDHVRCSDFVRVIVDLYRYQLGYSLDSED
ncbi:S-layer homology domain-containing protein [bacterium]|nr:S-layer homology domain-containing protein [bacterium]